MDILTSPVQIVRDSISTITQVLAERDISVYQRGMTASVQYDLKGRPVAVYLPYLPDDASEDLILSVQGFLDHEVGHLLFTDPEELKKISHDDALLEMQNILEDPFVERKMRARFPGCRENFNRLYGFFVHKVVDKNYQKLKREGAVNPMAYCGALFPCMARAWSGFEFFEEYMEDKWADVQPIVDKIEKLKPGLIESLAEANSTAENVENARVLLEAVMHVPEADYSMADTDEDDDISPPIGGEPGEGSPSSGSGASGSSSGGSSGLEDEEGGLDDDKKPDSSESDSKASDDEDGEDDEKEGEDSSGSESDPSADEIDEDEDEHGTEEKEEAGEPGDEEEDSEEEDSEDTDPETGGTGAADFDGEADDPTSGLSESEVGASDPEDESEEEDEAGADEEDGEGDDMWTPGDDESFKDHSIGDMDSCMSEVIGEEARSVAAASEYIIYSTDDDVIEPYEPKGLPDRRIDEALKLLDEKTSDLIGTMISDLERAFVAQNKSYWRSGQYSGRVNPSALSRLSVGDMRVFRKKVEHRTQDFDVSLLIDCSASMGCSSGAMTRIQTAIIAAYAMGQALDRIGINFEILGFTTKGTHEGKGISELRDKGLFVARYDKIWMPIFKAFEEPWGASAWRRLAGFFASPYMSENVDGECVMLAAQRLVRQKAKGKALLVMSDGTPACRSDDYAALQKHLKKVTKQLDTAGIKTIGIGIQTDAVRRFYEDHVVLSDLQSLPSTVIGRIRDVILG